MPTIRVPVGAKQMNLPNGMILKIPDGATQVNLPSDMDFGIPKNKEDNSFQAPLPPYQLINGVLKETEVNNPKKEVSLGDKVVGGLETGASLLTAATGGTLGNIYGTIESGINRITSNSKDSPMKEAEKMKRTAERYASDLTYQPRTQTGKQYLENTIRTLEPLQALAPLGGEINALLGKIKTPKKVQGMKEEVATLKQYLPELNSSKIKKETIRKYPDNTDFAGLEIIQNRIRKDKEAKEALKQGADRSVIGTLKSASPQDKVKMKEMLDIFNKGRKSAKYKALNRPADVVGDSLNKRIDFLMEQNKKAGNEIEKSANNLKNKPVNFDKPVSSFIQNLNDIGIKVSNDNGKFKIKLKNSDIEGDVSSKKLLDKIFNRIGSTNVRDGYEVHNMKRFIDTQVSYNKTKANPLSKKTESIVKGLRKGLNDVLREVSPEYKNANTKFSETIKALENIQKSAGSKVDLNSSNASKALGGTMRKLLSNYSSRQQLLDALENTNTVVKKYGMDTNDDLVKQVVFANEIDRLFGSQAPTSLKGQVNQALETGIEQAKNLSKNNGLVEISIKAIKSLINKSRGINEKNAIKALHKILEKDYMEVGKSFSTTPNKSNNITKNQSVNNLINKALSKYENSPLNQQPQVSKENGYNAMAPVKSATQKEKRGIYNVTFNDKLKTQINKSNMEDVLEYEKGSRKYGAKHIIRKHLGDGKTGELTKEDILDFGKVIREGKLLDDSFKETKNGISYVYSLKKDGYKLNIVVEETNDGKKILSGFSDKNFTEYKKPTGLH